MIAPISKDSADGFPGHGESLSFGITLGTTSGKAGTLTVKPPPGWGSRTTLNGTDRAGGFSGRGVLSMASASNPRRSLLPSPGQVGIGLAKSVLNAAADALWGAASAPAAAR